MERVAYALGAALGLSVPATYLEECEGHVGSAQLRLPGPDWTYAQASCSWLCDMIRDKHLVPLSILFDVWLANPDRHGRNVVLQPEPPGTPPPRAAECTMWLIDHERCGVWPPRAKFGADRVDEVDVPADGAMPPDVEEMIRTSMPDSYRSAFEGLSEDARKPLIEEITRVPDNVISEAVGEVPTNYIAAEAQSRTIQLLCARRDNIDKLARAVFPLPDTAPEGG